MAVQMLLRYFAPEVDFPFFIQMGMHRENLFQHTHTDFSELVVVMKGSALHQLANDVYPIARGDVFVVGGDISHGYADAQGLEICNIMFDPGLLDFHSRELKKLPGYQALFVVEPFLAMNYHFQARLHLSVTEQQWVDKAIQNMCSEYQASRPGRRVLLHGLLMEMVVHLSRWYEDRPTANAGDPIQVAKALAFMESKFMQDMGIEDIAARAFLSPRHFSRLFLESHGMSPHRYLMKIRISHACKLLAEKDVSVTDVALQSGFSDSNNFSRQFRHQMGMSPTQYRAAREAPDPP